MTVHSDAFRGAECCEAAPMEGLPVAGLAEPAEDKASRLDAAAGYVESSSESSGMSSGSGRSSRSSSPTSTSSTPSTSLTRRAARHSPAESAYHSEHEVDDYTDEHVHDSRGIHGVLRLNEHYTPKLRYPDLAAQVLIHTGALYGVYLMCTQCRLATSLWAFVTMYTSAFGITAGVHRLWSHRAYKASWQFRVLLMLLFTITGQRHIWAWVLDHRVHHRYSETDADPHDARRGFLFAHVGWLVLTPHPAVERARKEVDMSDLQSDGVVMWQKRWYEPLFALFTIALPVLVPVYFWQESLWASFWVNFNTRFSATLNVAFLINSLAHTHGFKPYDKDISPVESPILGLLAVGEGWHNFHHVFPWDYRTGELGNGRINLTTHFIDAFASLGWAWGLRSADDKVVQRRVERCGDGTGSGMFGASPREARLAGTAPTASAS
ncbi:(11Z)-hexadec-11-enoyl-CoA conjugase [Thrips palmi]|uniref:(11Z)-hexadec-11-enoyl-CoA conjugase n=1 Tax=Thrips palmi TaxID=161013 RepID=A0A6P8ZSX5_THRPL|nr:(11Z)-hexadec-11-enoyl-CoA conjugase [Thrips palmi]XP_034248133.1 (11Z)-hexadec-11-enoyl-CoA conjugase [Thrips palmi]XP_034248141.1 (11Z)-hexadec-11-enoyl-CoA conjugase [Thrips palmi]